MNQSKSMLKNIVVIGGGNGSATTINAVKLFASQFNISAVISMSDSGGSSGKLRQEFNVLPPGDILRAILAMSPYDYLTLKKIFHTNRFEIGGNLNKHNLGNIFLVLVEKYAGDYLTALCCLEQAVEAVGRVYPVTTDQTQLNVELTNGVVIETEEKIDRPEYDKKLKITKAWLNPVGKIYLEAKKVIEQADYVLMGPGSLYTSVVAALLPSGVGEVIKKSKAKLVYVMGNAFEIEGETGPEKMSDFVKELEIYLPRKIDLVIYNNHRLTEESKKNYQKRKWQLFKVDLENLEGYKIITGDYERKGGGLCSDKLGEILKTKVLK